MRTGEAGRRQLRRSIAGLWALGAVAVVSWASPASAAVASTSAAEQDRGPELTVPRSELKAAFSCPTDPTAATKTPIMFVSGTASTGSQGYALMQGAFERFGHPVCHVTFPDLTTADIQVSVQYLVYGLRREYELAGRKVAIYGISQGGLISRFALTYWPDLRRKVGDLFSAAGTQHGTDIDFGGCAGGCAPAIWQQLEGSRLLRALNAQPDETPGGVSYTTVRTEMDELVQPQTGKHPTSSLAGARNIRIQKVCPGRVTGHLGAIVNSVSFAAFTDAVGRRGRGIEGAARTSRLPAGVCDQPYAEGLVEAQVEALIAAAGGGLASVLDLVPEVGREPRVRAVFKR